MKRAEKLNKTGKKRKKGSTRRWRERKETDRMD